MRALIFVVLLVMGLSGCMPASTGQTVLVGPTGEVVRSGIEVLELLEAGKDDELDALLAEMKKKEGNTQLFVHTPDDGSPPYVTAKPPSTGTNVLLEPGGTK